MAFDLAHGGAYTSDRENCLFVATQYDRAAQSVGWRGSGDLSGLDYNNKQTKVAYVVSAIADDEIPARAMCSIARHIDAKRFKFQVYRRGRRAARRNSTSPTERVREPEQQARAPTLDYCRSATRPLWTAPVEGLIGARRSWPRDRARPRGA